jgi:hypothetical protein
MASTTATARRTVPVNGAASLPTARGPVVRRRVSVPRVLFGGLLVLGFALAGAVLANRIDTRLPVLAVAHAVDAGQTITDSDLSIVRVAADAEVATTPAAQRRAVVGRTATMPLAAGSLLTPAQIGAPVWPPAGQSAIALQAKAGHAPGGLVAGAHVTVLVVPTSSGTTTQGTTAQGAQPPTADATVVSIRPVGDQSGASVVTLLLTASDALRIAAASGEPVLVRLGAGR